MALLDEIHRLAEKCDQAISEQDEQSLRGLVEAVSAYTKEAYSDEQRGHAHYMLGNLYHALSRIENDTASGWRDGNFPGNLTAEINHCRNAYRLIPENMMAVRDQSRTNLSNALAHQRRNIEVLDGWKCDFSQKGDAPFVSALAKARELIWVSRFLNDPGHQERYQYEAYLLLKELNENRENTDHQSVLYALDNDPQILRFLENGEDAFRPLEDWKTKHPPDEYTTEEQAYRRWCLDERLFLNPINDLTTEWIADRDILQFPNHVVPVGQGPFFAASFSSLKREYSFARFMAYEGFHDIHPKFETDKLFLADTLDYVDYSGSTEKVKTAFRVCFSILDSLALLMGKYFECDVSHVAFSPRWIRDNLAKTDKNFFVDALYWLSCDLLDNEQVTSDSSKWKAPNPDAASIRKLRNAIEHGWLRVAESKGTVWQEGDFAHLVTKQELKSQTMTLLRMVRAALFYFTLAVKLNEDSKPDGDEITPPMSVNLVDDEFVS